MLPGTWKVPFDSSSFLSFPCSCKRFCRCCRELDSPATNPLKWLFPSLQLTVPSFPLALWKAEEWFGKVTLVLGCRTKSKRGGKETKHLQGLHKTPDNSSCSCAAFTPSIHLQGRKGHLFYRWKQKLRAVLCCKLIPWILSTFQLTQLRITWWFVGSFFPSSILPVCVGDAPLGWGGLEGPFLLWERKEDRKPPRVWRECVVLLWLQVISLIKKKNKNKKHHQTEHESVARQPDQRPPNKRSAGCLNHWRTHVPFQADGPLCIKKKCFKTSC